MFIDDDDTKAELPAHIVLQARDLLKLKTTMPARIGITGESVVELTKFGWMIMPPGQEDHSNVYLTQFSKHDYEQLHRLMYLV